MDATDKLFKSAKARVFAIKSAGGSNKSKKQKKTIEDQTRDGTNSQVPKDSYIPV
jgi:hypothetical protein